MNDSLEMVRTASLMRVTAAVGLASAALAFPAAWATPQTDTDAHIEQVAAPENGGAVDQTDIDAGDSNGAGEDNFIILEPSSPVVAETFSELPAPALGGNASRISQDGYLNEAAAWTSGYDNRTAQIQDGNYNFSSVYAAGVGNDIVTDQTGALNAAEISVVGNDLDTATIQIGDGLEIAIDRVGVGNGTPLVVVQDGTN